jgi:molybdate transport system substrate-binding protein
MRRWPPAAPLTAVLLLGACGGSSAAGGPAHVTLTVLAASSLSNVMPRIGTAFSSSHSSMTVRFTFAGTDSLAAEVEQGAPADVFAGASSTSADQLSSKGLIRSPRAFATNSLVVVAPPSNPAHIASPGDLAKPGVKLVVGASTVPIGSYTRTVLMNLDASFGSTYAAKVLANVVSNANNVESVLAAVEIGEADAGLVYVTDAMAAGSKVRVIMLPAEAQAVATYPVAVVTASEHAVQADTFVQFVLGPMAQSILGTAGFGPPSGA